MSRFVFYRQAHCPQVLERQKRETDILISLWHQLNISTKPCFLQLFILASWKPHIFLYCQHFICWVPSSGPDHHTVSQTLQPVHTGAKDEQRRCARQDNVGMFPDRKGHSHPPNLLSIVVSPGAKLLPSSCLILPLLSHLQSEYQNRYLEIPSASSILLILFFRYNWVNVVYKM